MEINVAKDFRNLEVFCPKCKKVTKIKVIKNTEDITVGRYTFPVELYYCNCSQCNGDLEHPYVDEVNGRLASEAYRKNAGIISNEKIHRILETLNLTTEELSEKCEFPVNRVLPFLWGKVNPNKDDSKILEKIYDENNIGDNYVD